MKQIIIRMFVAITMCVVTSVLRLTGFMVIAGAQPIHAESIWILRIILSSVLSPILFAFLEKRTSNWTIRPKHQLQSPQNSLNLMNHGQ